MSFYINGVKIGPCPKCSSDNLRIRNVDVLCASCGHAEDLPAEAQGVISVEEGSSVVIGGGINQPGGGTASRGISGPDGGGGMRYRTPEETLAEHLKRRLK